MHRVLSSWELPLYIHPIAHIAAQGAQAKPAQVNSSPMAKGTPAPLAATIADAAVHAIAPVKQAVVQFSV